MQENARRFMLRKKEIEAELRRELDKEFGVTTMQKA